MFKIYDFIEKWIICFTSLVGFQVSFYILKLFIKSSSNLNEKKNIHILRRIQHIFSGVILVFLYKFVIDKEFRSLFTFFGFLILFCLNFLRKRNEAINNWFTKTFSDILRKEELINQNQITSTYFMLGCTLSLILFEFDIACIAVLILSFGDPIASVIGIKYGKIKLYGEKSVMGNLSCSLCCGIITTIYLNYWYTTQINLNNLNNINKLIVGFITGCLAELMPSKFLFDDNTSIPIYSGVILSIINKIIE